MPDCPPCPEYEPFLLLLMLAWFAQAGVEEENSDGGDDDIDLLLRLFWFW